MHFFIQIFVYLKKQRTSRTPTRQMPSHLEIPFARTCKQQLFLPKNFKTQVFLIFFAKIFVYLIFL